MRQPKRLSDTQRKQVFRRTEYLKSGQYGDPFIFLIVIFFSALFFSVSLKAQDKEDGKLLLVLEGGVGLGSYRDFGASPLIVRGPELCTALSVEKRTKNWLFDIGAGLSGGTYGYRIQLNSFFTYGGHLSAYTELLRSFYCRNGWQFWCGAGIDDLFDIRYNKQLSNASVGMSNFFRLRLSVRAEYSWNRWCGYAQLWTDPVALLLRPGFSYINNYDRDIANPVGNAFDQYEWYMSGLTGIASRVGVRCRLDAGNEVGVAYCWGYLTSRVSSRPGLAPWRFQQAGHGLTFQLLFNL